MSLTPASVYQQCTDKQRIVITGQGSSVISAIIHHALNQYHRKFDFVSNHQEGKHRLSDAPLVIIQSPPVPELADYKHHIGVLSQSDSTHGLEALRKFADATPKSGILIYPELDPRIKSIGNLERADVLAIPYKAYTHEVQSGKTILITSTNERVPIGLTGDLNLQYVSAAKEVLKKIGITSGQFYKALATFQLN